MDCQACKQLLVDFLYEDLDPDQRRAFSAHLEGCPDCAREAEQLGRVLALVRAHPEEAPADEISQRILHTAKALEDQRAAGAHPTRSAGWWGWLLSPAPMTAVLALVVVSVGLAIYLGRQAPQEAPAPAGSQAVAELAPAGPAKAAPGQAAWDATPVDSPVQKDQKEEVGHAGGKAPGPALRGHTRTAGKVSAAGELKAPAPPPPPADVNSAPAPAGARGPGAKSVFFQPVTDKPAAGSARPKSKKRSKDAGRSHTVHRRGVLGGAVAEKADEQEELGTDRVAGDASPATLAKGGDVAASPLSAPAGAPLDLDGVAQSGLQTARDLAKARAESAPKAGAAPERKPARFAVPPPGPAPVADEEQGRQAKKAERSAATVARMTPAAESPAAKRPAARPQVPEDQVAEASQPDEMAYKATDDIGDGDAGFEREARSLEDSVRAEPASSKPAAHRPQAPKVDPAVVYAQADRALARKEYDVAALGFRTFIQTSPGDARAATARYRLVKALFMAGRCAEVITAAQQAMRFAPRHRLAADALFDLASCHIRLGQFEPARQVYQRIERDHPGRAAEARREAERIRR